MFIAASTMEDLPFFSDDQWILDGFVLPESVIQERIGRASKDSEAPVQVTDVVRKVDVAVPTEVYEYVAELCRSMCLSVLILHGPDGSHTFELGGRSRIYADAKLGSAGNANVRRIDSLNITQIRWEEAA